MSNYKDIKDAKKLEKARRLVVDKLPWFCHKYYENSRDLKGGTRYAYSLELLRFFTYLHDNVDGFDKPITKFTIDDIRVLKKPDLEKYFTYKETYLSSNNGTVQTKTTKARSLHRIKSCLNSFWNYYVDEGILEINPVSSIKLPKIGSKDPISLNMEEKDRLYNVISNGIGLPAAKLAWHQKLKERDFAIVFLFLHTGMRVSELVGINIDDIDFVEHSVRIPRKRDKEQEVFFSDDTEKYIQDYLRVRVEKLKPIDTEALFINRNGTRMSERSVEQLLKKYIKIAIPNKIEILSCHKLRSSYACDMLEKTNSLELVSKLLGHESIQTTQIYAGSGKQARKDVRNVL